MRFDILTIPNFDKQFKRLAKKYPSLKEDIKPLLLELQKNPVSGIPLGNDCYKIRISIRSKSKGKSGGGRIITLVKISLYTVFLVSIWDKSESDSISEKELAEILSKIVF